MDGGRGVIIIVFNTTFNTISVILWWSGLLVEETGVPGENDLWILITPLVSSNSSSLL